jgi:autoinducer 2-degrading protein
MDLIPIACVLFFSKSAYNKIYSVDFHLLFLFPMKEVPMFIVHVFVHVKAESVEAFKAATVENARNSVQEPGIARFDVVQQIDDPEKFILVECYRTEADPAEHKKTPHYQTWRNTVADMMAEPRSSVKYDNVFPDDQGWG